MTIRKARSADGTSIAFETFGEGAPVVLVGGAFNDRHARGAGAPLARLLAPAMKAIAYDRRGRGDSDEGRFAVEREVEDLAAVIAANEGNVAVYGMSSGAILALEAATRGVPIEKLVLFEPPLVLDPMMASGQEAIAIDLEHAAAEGRRSDAAEIFLSRVMQMPPVVVARMKASPMWPGLEALAPTLFHDVRITMLARSLLERAPSIATPTLLLHGDKGFPWMREAIVALAQALPNGEAVLLEGQSHDIDIEVLAKPLLAFLVTP